MSTFCHVWRVILEKRMRCRPGEAYDSSCLGAFAFCRVDATAVVPNDWLFSLEPDFDRTRYIREWRPDEDQGTDWYRRAMRAHANCLENLPIYIVVVIALLVTETKSPWLDGLAIILLIARIAHNPCYILAPCRRTRRRWGRRWCLPMRK